MNLSMCVTLQGFRAKIERFKRLMRHKFYRSFFFLSFLIMLRLFNGKLIYISQECPVKWLKCYWCSEPTRTIREASYLQPECLWGSLSPYCPYETEGWKSIYRGINASNVTCTVFHFFLLKNYVHLNYSPVCKQHGAAREKPTVNIFGVIYQARLHPSPTSVLADCESAPKFQ